VVPEHRLLAPSRGRPLVWWALAAATDAGLDEVAVVVGATESREVVPPECG
jgi:CTP:molybdopterin cytidylyltransferase MocA